MADRSTKGSAENPPQLLLDRFGMQWVLEAYGVALPDSRLSLQRVLARNLGAGDRNPDLWLAMSKACFYRAYVDDDVGSSGRLKWQSTRVFFGVNSWGISCPGCADSRMGGLCH